jgi:DNA ligase 1
MRAFSELFDQLERATQGSERIAAFEDYFRSVPAADASWAVWILVGGRLKRSVTPVQLRRWVAETAELPLWLVEECHATVGDLGETLALLLPPRANPSPPTLAELARQRLLPLSGASEAVQRALIRRTWLELDTHQSHVWHRLITGTLRVGNARSLLARALANLAAITPSVMVHRLMGEWEPTPDEFLRLLSPETADEAVARAYPFPPSAHIQNDSSPDDNMSALVAVPDRGAIRAQLIWRAGQARCWTCEGDWITEAIPEITDAARALPDGTVLDGVVVAWHGDCPLPLAELRRRLNRRGKRSGSRDSATVVFVAHNLLERNGVDWRAKALNDRREALENIVTQATDRYVALQRKAPDKVLRQGDLFAADEVTDSVPFALRLGSAPGTVLK